MTDPAEDEALGTIAEVLKEAPASFVHRLSDLVISRVAGVDRPAHQVEGWAVLKNVGERAAGSDGGGRTVDSALDRAAKSRAAQTGEPFAKAYAEVLASPEGAAMYAAYDQAYMQPEDGPARPTDEELQKAAESQAVMARALVRKARDAFPGVPEMRAVSQFLLTEEGERAYAAHERAGRI